MRPHQIGALVFLLIVVLALLSLLGESPDTVEVVAEPIEGTE